MRYDNWWQKGPDGDQQMEESHQKAWAATIARLDEKTIEGREILDIGCNQGGFLRILYEKIGFKQAVGIDLARKAIATAKQRVGHYPIKYYITDEARVLNRRFDTVICTSVLYLISDLNHHFQMVKEVLKDDGCYYATFTDHSQNPSLSYMQQQINQYGATKMQNHTLTDIVDGLLEQGFSVQLVKEQPEPIYDVSNYREFYQSVTDCLTAVEQSYLIIAKR